MEREQCVVCPEETKERLKQVDLGEFALQKVVAAQSMKYLKECHALSSHHQTFICTCAIYSALMSASTQDIFLQLGTSSPHFSPTQALCFCNYFSSLWTESILINIKYNISHLSKTIPHFLQFMDLFSILFCLPLLKVMHDYLSLYQVSSTRK